VTLDKHLTWLHIDQVRKKVAQRLRVVSIRNGLLLYKQHICLVMDYACLSSADWLLTPIWRSRRCIIWSVFILLPVHLSCVGNIHIHKDREFHSVLTMS
jgi:hypothetical protein